MDGSDGSDGSEGCSESLPDVSDKQFTEKKECRKEYRKDGGFGWME